jgi:hypothetical protein
MSKNNIKKVSQPAELRIKNQETPIVNLARNNDIIKSLFHFKKPISFVVVQIAIQKIRKNNYVDRTVFITKKEIKEIATGNDSKIGISGLVEEIRADIEDNSFFNIFEKGSGLKNARRGLIDETAITDDIFEDLYIEFKESLFAKFKLTNDYTNQSKEQLILCENDQQRINLYTLCQQHASKEYWQKSKNGKYQIKPLSYDIYEIRTRLGVKSNQYAKTNLLTLQVKRICQKITKKNDINIILDTAKVGRKTSHYIFHITFKENPYKKKTQQIQQAEIIFDSYESIQQQLKSWKIGNPQIEMWCHGFSVDELSKAINKTLANAKTNHGGYLYEILGNGKNEAKTKNLKSAHKKTIEYKLEQVGFNTIEIQEVKNKTSQVILVAVINQLLRDKKNNQITGCEKDYFNNLLININKGFKGKKYG